MEMGGVFAEGMTNPVTQHQNNMVKRNVEFDTSQPELENDYASVENPRDFLF